MEIIKKYCKAPAVSVSIWPNNKVAPCCIWQGPTWSSLDAMRNELTAQFDNNKIPEGCNGCSYRHTFDNYSEDRGLQMLDVRNDNLCNLRCRSCTPQWSSLIAQEEKIYPIRNFLHFDLDSLEWNNIETVYICGGEPFISAQHKEILEKIKYPQQTKLLYNTNCTVIKYQGIYIPDLWENFAEVVVNVSIDAVDHYAEVVRSGCNWNKVNDVLTQFEQLAQQNKIKLNVVPYISALNIWWIDSWSARFKDWAVEQVNPIISAENDLLGVGIIPHKYRPELIRKLTDSKFQTKFAPVVEILKTVDDTHLWDEFLFRQTEIDQNRNENWTALFDQYNS